MKYVGSIVLVVLSSACRLDFEVQVEPVDGATGTALDSSSGSPVDAAPGPAIDAAGTPVDAGQGTPGSAVVTTGADFLPPTDTTATVPVDPPVDPAHSVLFFNVTHNSYEPNNGHVTGRLNATGDAVIFERPSTNPNPVAVEIEWSIVESPSFQVQRDTTVMSMALGPTRDIALATPVADLTRAFAIATARLEGISFGWNDWAMVQFANESTLRIDRTTGTCCDATVEWQVVEFTPDSNVHVQADVVRLAPGQTFAEVDLVQSAPMDRSFVLFTQNTIDDVSSAAKDYSIRGEMLTDNRIAFTRPDGANTIDVGWFVVTWEQLRAKHGSAPFAGSQSEVIVSLDAPVAPENSVSFLPGMMRQGSAPGDADRMGLCWFTTSLINNGAELRIRRGDTGFVGEATWSVIEFQ